MHWQEACLKSKSKMAIRNDKCGNIERFMIVGWDGEALISINGREFRKAFPNEFVGYNDWKPY